MTSSVSTIAFDWHVHPVCMCLCVSVSVSVCVLWRVLFLLAVQHWQLSSGECVDTFTDKQNEVFALDYNAEGTQFATGGRDAKIRLYDEGTKTNVATLEGGNIGDGSATNRVFSVKFTHDENILLSGGWDNTVSSMFLGCFLLYFVHSVVVFT